MTITIKAEHGYRVHRCKFKHTGEPALLLYDGDTPTMLAHPMTYEDFKDEMKQNECFHICEKFSTVKGNFFIYARDEEADWDFLVKVPK